MINSVFMVFMTALAGFSQPGNVNKALPFPIITYNNKVMKGDYLGAWLELKNHETDYRLSAQKSQFLEIMSVINSQVGNYRQANVYLDDFFGEQKRNEKDLEKSPIDGFQPRGAIEAISAEAEKHQVVMINEEHDTPMHRAFTARLLPLPYARGFRYLAAETIGEDETELNKRGYPILKTGFYSADPVYGDLIRTALKLGFKVVPYEYAPVNCKSPEDNQDFCQNERERGQAQNLYDRILKNDPQAKILVHVGRGHNQEANFKTWAMMAWHFKDISKIDPYTIGQMHMSDRSRPESETPLYRYAINKWKFTEPTVFQSEEGKFWSEPTYDLTVFHPRTVYKNGRPTWLEMGGARKPLNLYGKVVNNIAQPFLPQPVGTFLIQAFVAGESNDAIPIDQIIVNDPKTTPVLMLPPKGNFRLKAIDETGKVVVDVDVSLD